MSGRGKFTRSTLVLLPGALALLAAPPLSAQNLEIVRAFERPDGACRVVLLRKPMAAAMPGQASVPIPKFASIRRDL